MPAGARREDRGEVTGAVILLPVVVTMVFLVIQAALVFHARAIVAAAAEDGARAAQAQGASAADGRGIAMQVLDGSSSLIPAPVIDVQRTATDVRVTVRAAVRSPIPWFHPTVSASAGGAVERFIPEDER
jgi:Flp pilus assembly protein TadG